MMIDLAGFKNQYQDQDEIAWLLEQVRGINSVLEIGSAEGHTMRMFAGVAAPGAKLRSVDIAESPYFMQAMNALRRMDFDAEQIIADSQSPDAIRWARENGPYELVFIDADHGPSVVGDWLNYGPMATRFIAFHDISVTHPHVRKLWTETIVPRFRTEEMLINREQFGIGLIKLHQFHQGQSHESTSAGIQLAAN